MNSPRTQVFVSYSRKDARWLELLQTHLRPLVRDGDIDLWDDTRIPPGSDWKAEIDDALRRAQVAVLLVTANFLASDFVHQQELPVLLEAARTRGTRILPLIVGHSQYQTSALGRFGAVNDPARPLQGLAPVKRDAVLAELARTIADATRTGPTTGTPSSPEAATVRPSPATASPPEPDRPPRLQVPPDYLSWLHERYASVELLGQDQQQGRSITLESVYVPAVTLPEQQQSEVDERDADGIHGARLRDTSDVSDREKPAALLLNRLGEQSLYLPGAPGSGKSTFCRWAVLQTAALSPTGAQCRHPVPAPEGYDEAPLRSLREHLPVLVPLREFWPFIDAGHGQRSWTRPGIERAVTRWLGQQNPNGLDPDSLPAYLQAGRTLLLLDGLDEVPIAEPRGDHSDFPRALLLSALEAALPAWQRAGNRILLTSRPYGLDETGLARLKLPRAPLEPVPGPLQDLFVQRWFHTLNKPALADDLQRDLQGRQELDPLRGNPMLLTALCVLYGNRKRLPEDRYELYQRIIENVLYSRYKGDAGEREPVRARLQAIAYGMHTGEWVENPYDTPVAEVSWREVERNLQVFAASNPTQQDGLIQPAIRRERLLTRSGLLLPRSGERAAFYHLSFQEFLAAEYLSRTLWDPAALEALFVRRGAFAEWHSTLLFLFSAIVATRNPEQGVALLQSLASRLDRKTVKANPAPAVLVAGIIELALARQYRLPDDLTDRMRSVCRDAIEDELPPPERLTLGLCLGDLGDPRIPALRDPAAYVEVPAGDYPYGDENDTITIPAPFRLSRYLVTNGQYRAFWQDGGYENADWWSEAGWNWREQRGITEPANWRDRRWNAPNLPVVGLSFWEAEACCAWTGGRLPTEQEWEAAARGPDGCKYPWCGDWEDGICNSYDTGLNRTSPVGLFPRSRQAQLDLEDLTGNVWEWCDSLYQHDDDSAGPRVLRGGAFVDRGRGLRASYRGWVEPELRVQGFGFRCVLAPRRQP